MFQFIEGPDGSAGFFFSFSVKGVQEIAFFIYVYFFFRRDLGLQWTKVLNEPLEVVDPEIADIIELEKARQWKVSFFFLFFLKILYMYRKASILLMFLCLIETSSSVLYILT